MLKDKAINISEILLVTSLFLVVFVIGADSFIISPLLPAISQAFQTTLPNTALAVTIYALCYAVGAPFLGPLGDRFSQRLLLKVGLSLFLAGSLLCALASAITQFYLFRGLAGIGAALTLPNVWATIGNRFTGKARNNVMGITMSALSLSIAIGVPLGSWLAQLTDWHMVFWASAVLTVFPMFPLFFTPVGSITLNKKPVNYFTHFRRLFTTRHAALALLINLSWMFGFYLMYTFLGAHLSQTFHLSAGQSGTIFMIYGLGNFISSFFAGLVTSAIGAHRSIILNGVFSVILILGIGQFSNSLNWLMILLLLLSICQGLGVTALTTLIVGIAPQNRSTMMAFNSASLYLALTLASSLGGQIYTLYSFNGLNVVAAIGLAVAVLLTIRISTR